MIKLNLNIYKILILALGILVFISLLISTVDFYSAEDIHQKNCKEICNSNYINYYKYTNSGYAMSQHTCYCKDAEGRISTYQM